MTNRIFGVVVVILCLGIASCGREQPAANGQSKATAPQWEYKVVNMMDKVTFQGNVAAPKKSDWEKYASDLSEYYTSLGAEGWEYVATHDASLVLFKRPKR